MTFTLEWLIALSDGGDRLCFDNHRERAMTPHDVITIFERLNAEGRAAVDLDHACTGFAGWLAGVWDTLGEEDIALLTSIGATLYREGYGWRY